MAIDVKDYNSAGLAWLGYAVRDSSGYLVGSTGTAPAAGNQDGLGLVRLTGAKTFPFQEVEGDRVTVTGDDAALATFLFDPIEFPNGTFTTGQADQDFEALCRGTAVHDLGGFSFIPRQPDTPTYADLVILAVSRAQSQTSGQTGSMYECTLILNSNVTPLGKTGANERAEGEYSYSFVCNNAEAYPWGLAFSAGNNGTTKMPATTFTSPGIPVLWRYTGDGSETTFNLPELIKQDDADHIIAYVNGVAQTWVTGVPGAGEFGITESTTDTIVFGTAPASSAKVVILYAKE